MSDEGEPVKEDLLKAFEPWVKADADRNHPFPYRLMTWIEFTAHADALVQLCETLAVRKLVIEHGEFIKADLLLTYAPGTTLPITPEHFVAALRNCTDDAKARELQLIPLGLMPETNVERVKAIMSGEAVFEWTFALGFNKELFVPLLPPVPADEG